MNFLLYMNGYRLAIKLVLKKKAKLNIRVSNIGYRRHLSIAKLDTKISDLVVNLKNGSKLNIYKTPHYKFIKNSDVISYQEYYERYFPHLEVKEQIEKFSSLADELTKDSSDVYIVGVLDNNDKISIVDGVHRAAIIAAQSRKKISVFI